MTLDRTIHRKIRKFTLKSEALAVLPLVSTSVTCLTTDALMKPSMELIMKYTMPTTATLDAVGPSRGLNKTTQHEKLK